MTESPDHDSPHHESQDHDTPYQESEGEAAARRNDLAWAEDPLWAYPALPVPVMLRAARRFADLSQRELAARVGISKSYVGDLESGDVTAPSYLLVQRLIEAAGLRLVVVGPFLMPLMASRFDAARDAAGRHWPGHLEVREVLSWQDWWRTRRSPGDGPEPSHTADWRRNAGRPRLRRPKSERNTPPAPRLRPEGDDGG